MGDEGALTRKLINHGEYGICVHFAAEINNCGHGARVLRQG